MLKAIALTTVKLSAWEMLALETSLDAAIIQGQIHQDHGLELLRKIRAAQEIVVRGQRPGVPLQD